MIQMKLYAKQKKRQRCREEMHDIKAGKAMEWDKLGDWD